MKRPSGAAARLQPWRTTARAEQERQRLGVASTSSCCTLTVGEGGTAKQAGSTALGVGSYCVGCGRVVGLVACSSAPIGVRRLHPVGRDHAEHPYSTVPTTEINQESTPTILRGYYDRPPSFPLTLFCTVRNTAPSLY